VATLRALEYGQRPRPHPQTLARLADALGLSPADREALLDSTGSGEQTSHARGERVSLDPHTPKRPAAPRLPIWLTTFVGRETEVDSVRGLLDPHGSAVRLLTLVGPGGVGKTRLAVAAAAALAPVYSDGVTFVDLAPLHDARLVPATIARALNLREGVGHSAREQLLEHLHQRQVLLLLDNFEHLLDARQLVLDLVQRCPRVAVLVTSRAALRVQVERRLAVEPLATPPTGDDSTPSALSTSPAVQLFMERAQAVAEVALTRTNALAVASLCRALDGLPLAIELAAARIPLLPPQALLSRLKRGLPVLSGGGADLPARQQALRQTIAWSYDLLGPAEQVLLRRLAVFAGGWTLEAAEAVCANCGAQAEGVQGSSLPAEVVLDGLEGLVDNSLIQVAERAVGDPRFRMLETIREYAEERLLESGEAELIQGRHRDWFVKLVEQVAPELIDQVHLQRLEIEQDNLRAALRWSITHGDAEPGLRLGIACWPMWYRQARYAEGLFWLRELVVLPGATGVPVLHGRALAYAGNCAYGDGQLELAEEWLRTGLDVSESAGDLQGLRDCSMFLGTLVGMRGALDESEALYARAIAFGRRLGEWVWEAAVVTLLGQIQYERGDALTARRRVAEALDICRVRNLPTSRGRALVLSGRLGVLDGDVMAGMEQMEEGLSLLRGLRDQTALCFGYNLAAQADLDCGDNAKAARHLAALLEIARDTHEQLASVHGLEGAAELLADADPERAVRLVATAAAVRRQLGCKPLPRERARLDRWLAAARGAVADSVATLEAADASPPLAAALADAIDACTVATA
jgi:predicted ATPase